MRTAFGQYSKRGCSCGFTIHMCSELQTGDVVAPEPTPRASVAEAVGSSKTSKADASVIFIFMVKNAVDSRARKPDGVLFNALCKILATYELMCWFGTCATFELAQVLSPCTEARMPNSDCRKEACRRLS